jgi:hypothetical protein
MLRGLLSSIVIAIAGLAYDPPAPAPSELIQVAQNTQTPRTAQRPDIQVMTAASLPDAGTAYSVHAQPRSRVPLYLLRFLPLCCAGYLAVWVLVALVRQSHDGEGSQ